MVDYCLLAVLYTESVKGANARSLDARLIRILKQAVLFTSNNFQTPASIATNI